jgi:hypothetical protein
MMDVNAKGYAGGKPLREIVATPSKMKNPARRSLTGSN